LIHQPWLVNAIAREVVEKILDCDRSRPIATEMVAQAIENIGDILNQATFRPHIEDGRPAGISITGIKPNAIFRRLRLRNGDVITGVNGQTVASVEDAMSVFGGLSLDGPIQVNIKRRGREETLEYNIE
jgi:general secretion pathway protein C